MACVEYEKALFEWAAERPESLIVILDPGQIPLQHGRGDSAPYNKTHPLGPVHRIVFILISCWVASRVEGRPLCQRKGWDP